MFRHMNHLSAMILKTEEGVWGLELEPQKAVCLHVYAEDRNWVSSKSKKQTWLLRNIFRPENYT